MTDQAFDAEPGARFDPEAAAACVVDALRPQADADRATQAKRYLKSDLEFLGVSVPAIRQAVIEKARKYPGLGRDDAAAWGTGAVARTRARAADRRHRGAPPARRAAPLRAASPRTGYALKARFREVSG